MKKLREFSDKDFIIEQLTLQYLQGKSANSALEYVKLYRKTKDEIKSAFEETEEQVNWKALL